MKMRHRKIYCGIVIGILLIFTAVFIVNYINSRILPSELNEQKIWQEFIKQESWQLNTTYNITESELYSDLTGLQATGSLSYDLTQNGYALQCSLSYRNASLLSVHSYLDDTELIVKIPSLSTGIYKGNTHTVFDEAFHKIFATSTDTFSGVSENTINNIVNIQRLPLSEQGYDGATINLHLDEIISFQIFWKGSLSEQYHYTLEDAYIIWNNKTLFHFSGTFDLEHLNVPLSKPTGTEHAFWDLLDLFDWRTS